MKACKTSIHILLIVLGIIMVACSAILGSRISDTISGLCYGIGSGLCGMSIAYLLMQLYYKQNPELQKQSDIEARDERSITITCKAKAKAFDYTIRLLILFPFLMIITDLPLWLMFTTIAIYLFGYGVQFYYMVRYNREM